MDHLLVVKIIVTGTARAASIIPCGTKPGTKQSPHRAAEGLECLAEALRLRR